MGVLALGDSLCSDSRLRSLVPLAKRFPTASGHHVWSENFCDSKVLVLLPRAPGVGAYESLLASRRRSYIVGVSSNEPGERMRRSFLRRPFLL